MSPSYSSHTPPLTSPNSSGKSAFSGWAQHAPKFSMQPVAPVALPPPLPPPLPPSLLSNRHEEGSCTMHYEQSSMILSCTLLLHHHHHPHHHRTNKMTLTTTTPHLTPQHPMIDHYHTRTRTHTHMHIEKTTIFRWSRRESTKP